MRNDCLDDKELVYKKANSCVESIRVKRFYIISCKKLP